MHELVIFTYVSLAFARHPQLSAFCTLYYSYICSFSQRAPIFLCCDCAVFYRGYLTAPVLANGFYNFHPGIAINTQVGTRKDEQPTVFDAILPYQHNMY